MSFGPGSFNLEIAIPEPSLSNAIQIHDERGGQSRQVVSPASFRVAEREGTVPVKLDLDGRLAVSSKSVYWITVLFVLHTQSKRSPDLEEDIGGRFGFQGSVAATEAAFGQGLS